jgi:hypothetical protein
MTETPARAYEHAGCVRRAWTALALAGLLVVGVAGAADPPSTRYLPPDPVAIAPPPGVAGAGEGPDLLLLAFSGRCALRSCTPPDENEDALARSLVPAALAAWRAAGLTADAWTYRSHVDDDPVRGRGYLSAVADLQSAVRDGTIGPGSPTRVVLLGYSHGTQWAHLIAFEHPEVAFAASVLLDSICLGWDADHAARLVAAVAPGRGRWSAEGPYTVGCDVLSVPGVLGHLDLGDVVPWNVERSLEVWSGGQALGVVRDVRRNVRPDGSRSGLSLSEHPEMRHQASDEPDGVAFAVWASWVVELVRAP